jgi:N6-L-threonylcarbamoyladenine synthase
MIILGIETSCDETSAALIEAGKKDNKVKLLSNVISTSLSLHAKTGGIIPEIAAREQLKYILPVIEDAIKKINNPQKNIDEIAVTVGPGLIGSLLVGVETAKTLSYIWNKPIIPVNHLFGHIYANWIESEDKRKLVFPAIALIVSGGHTDLLLMKNHDETVWLGGTRDDAAGEAFDKTGRILNLPYPAGPLIEKLAQKENKDFYYFPKPLIDSSDFDFSFSGLKTAVLREVQNTKNLDSNTTSKICYSLQQAIFEVLITKTLKATQKFKAKSILLGGGVSANQSLRKEFEIKIETLNLKIPLFIPQKWLCTDNAAMIAAAGFYKNENSTWKDISANPELYFD